MSHFLFSLTLLCSISLRCLCRITTVEKIDNIFVYPTEINIKTNFTKSEASGTRVTIKATNLGNGISPPALDLSGFLLDGTRGNYWIRNLEPNTWYAVVFHLKQNAPIQYTHSEYKLIQTPSKDGKVSSDLVETERVLIGTDTIQLVARSKSNNPNFKFIIKADMVCKGRNETKRIKLDQKKYRGSVNFKVRKVKSFRPKDGNSTHLIAVLQPDECDQICWSSWLTSPLAVGSFRLNYQCAKFEDTIIEVAIRRLDSVQATNDSVMVKTIYKSNLNEDYAQVTLTVEQLNTSESDKLLFAKKTFHASEGSFNMTGLKPNIWYLLLYNYTLLQPILYNSVERQAFKTCEEAPCPMDVKPVEVNFDLEEEMLYLTLTRTEELENYPIRVTVMPFCSQNGSMMILDRENNEQRLQPMNVSKAIELITPEEEMEENDEKKEYNDDYDYDYDEQKTTNATPRTTTMITTTKSSSLVTSNCEQVCWGQELVLDQEMSQDLGKLCREFQKIARGEENGAQLFGYCWKLLCFVSVLMYL